MISHKKNQSISALESEIFNKNKTQATKFDNLNRGFNNSVTSNLSKTTKNTLKAKSKDPIITKENKSKTLNLSASKKPLKQSRKKQSTHISSIPMGKNEESLIKELGDVMSSSQYSQSEHCSSPMSGADPDMQPQLVSHPEDSISDLNKSNPKIKKENNLKQVEQKMAVTQEVGTRTTTVGVKSRPSSAITNYTSGPSAIRSKIRQQQLLKAKITQISPKSMQKL